MVKAKVVNRVKSNKAWYFLFRGSFGSNSALVKLSSAIKQRRAVFLLSFLSYFRFVFEIMEFSHWLRR